MVLGIPLVMQDYEAVLDFQVMHLARADVYLGREWLFSLGPNLVRSYLHNTLQFEYGGSTITL